MILVIIFLCIAIFIILLYFRNKSLQGKNYESVLYSKDISSLKPNMSDFRHDSQVEMDLEETYNKLSG